MKDVQTPIRFCGGNDARKQASVALHDIVFVAFPIAVCYNTGSFI